MLTATKQTMMHAVYGDITQTALYQSRSHAYNILCQTQAFDTITKYRKAIFCYNDYRKMREALDTMRMQATGIWDYNPIDKTITILF